MLINLSKESIAAKFLFFLAKTFNSWRDHRVGKSYLLSRESQSSSNIVRVDVWVVNQWWIRMILRRKHSVPNICCPCWIQATHACHSQVAHRLFGLWSPRRFVVVSFDAGPMFPCNKKYRSNEQLCLRKPWASFFYQKLEIPESGSTLHQLWIMVA